jgi:hypothetical protein
VVNGLNSLLGGGRMPLSPTNLRGPVMPGGMPSAPGGGMYGGQPPMSGPMPINLPAREQTPGRGMPGGGYGANPPGRILPPQMPVQPGFGMNPPQRILPAQMPRQSLGNVGPAQPFSVGSGWLDWRHPMGGF